MHRAKVSHGERHLTTKHKEQNLSFSMSLGFFFLFFFLNEGAVSLYMLMSAIEPSSFAYGRGQGRDATLVKHVGQ